MEAEIIYEDKEIIVAYKPAGLATQTSRLGQQDMVSLLKNYRAKKKEEPYIGLIHRLDQPVEGLLVFAKTKEAAGRLSRQLNIHSLGKYYYAIGQATLSTALPQPEGNLTDYLLTDKRTNHTRVVEKGTPEAKEARLHYRVVGSRQEGNLRKLGFSIALETGRQHQIRVQLAQLGYPLVGDSKYGQAEGEGKQQMALCAYCLKLCHPQTGKQLEFTIEPHNPAFLDIEGWGQ